MLATSLPTADWIVIGCYLAASMAIGLAFGRGEQTAEGYLVGGRQFGWPLLLFSIVATETSTVTFLSLPGKSFADGGNLTFLQLAIGYIVGRLIVVWVLLPNFFRGDYLTAYQVLEERYGSGVRSLASVIFLVMRNVSDGLRLFLTGLLVSAATGLDFDVSVIVLAACTAAYAVVGGVTSVVVNDFVQFTMYTIGAVAALFVLLGDVPGGATAVWEFASETGRLQLFDFSLSLTTSSVTLLSGVIGGAALTMASHGADHMMVQRYLCARSPRQAGIALGLSGPVVFAQFSLFLFVGIGLACLYSTAPPEYAAEGGDQAFIGFIVNRLGIGLRGFVIASVLAASMSTLSSSLNSSAGVVVSDLASWFCLPPDRSKTVAAARVATVAACLFQIGIALVTYHFALASSVIDAALAVAGFSTGLLLGLYALAIWLGKVNQTVGVSGLLCGLVACCVVAFGLRLSWPWYSLVGSTTTIAAGLLFSTFVRLNRTES
ncbi:MAG: transporter [Planctomycetota bacterium]